MKFQLELEKMEAGSSQAKERAEKAREERDIIKADALETATHIVRQDEVQYHTLYAKLIASGDTAKQRDKLDEVANGISSKCKDKQVLQPKFDGIDETSQKGKYIQQIWKKFDALSDDMELVFESISSETGSTFQPGPNKKIERIFEKANLSYSGNLRRVTDYKRVTFICETFNTLSATLRVIDGKFEIVRVKNRFSKKNRTAKETGGYRDCQILVRLLPSGLLLEVQLHLLAIHDLKTKIGTSENESGRTGHERYIEFRTLKEKADLL